MRVPLPAVRPDQTKQPESLLFRGLRLGREQPPADAAYAGIELDLPARHWIQPKRANRQRSGSRAALLQRWTIWPCAPGPACQLVAVPMMNQRVTGPILRVGTVSQAE